jgi:pyruvate-ferredoxin/flavodoxin oxidoreductase
VHAGHDDYHCVDDTGFIQMMAKNATEAADLNLIGRKIAELSLTPAIVGQDGFLTSHLIESCVLPERELVAEFLGRPDDMIESPTPGAADAVRPEAPPRAGDLGRGPAAPVRLGAEPGCLHAGHSRRSVPISSTTSSRSTDACMEEYAGLTGRSYQRVSGFKTEDADYIILGMGSMIVQAEAVADYLRETRKLKVGVVNLTMFRPSPATCWAGCCAARRAWWCWNAPTSRWPKTCR